MKKQKTALRELVDHMKNTTYYGKTLMSNTAVIRFIKYFPKHGNQNVTILFYNKIGNIITHELNCYGISSIELRNALSKRIVVIEDYSYMTKKDFLYFS